MKKVLMMALTLAVAAAPAFAQDKKAAAAKTMTATGDVTAVAADSLTVKTAKAGDLTFTVDTKTAVQAKGATHKTEAAKADSKPTPITDFVKVGDHVSVKYHDMGATKHAADVRVLGSMPAAPAKKK